MKPLNKNKKYDLSDLNDEQLIQVLNYLKNNDENWEYKSFEDFKIYVKVYFLKPFFDTWIWTHDRKNLTNALELFPIQHDFGHLIDQLIKEGEKKGLKIVVTVEKYN